MHDPPAPDLEAPCLVAQSPAEGIPQQFAVGDGLRLSLSALSEGGAATGLSVLAWGSALSEALVVIDRFELLCGNLREGARHVELVPAPRTSLAGEALWVAEAPDAVIAPRGARVLPRSIPVGTFVDAWSRRTVHVNAVGRVLKAGTGTLSLALVPVVHRDGAAAVSWAVAVDPPLPRPLRCSLSPHLETVSHVLRGVAGDRYLYAMVALGASRAEGATLACEGLHETVAVLGTAWGARTGVFRAQPGAKPLSWKSTLAVLLKGARYEKLCAALRDELMVSLTAVAESPTTDPRGFEHHPACWGLTYGTHMIPDHDGDRAATLLLWVDTQAVGPEKTTILRARWAELVARAMAAGGLQGVVHRCDGAMGSTVDYTPYEMACGTSGAMATGRAWLLRWVRVPGNDTLWLGPALAAHLDHEARANLAAVAEVQALDSGVLRVALRSPNDRAAWEQALAPVLATEADARDAMQAWYAPR